MARALIQGWSRIAFNDPDLVFEVKTTVAEGGFVYTDYMSDAIVDANDSAAQIRAKVSEALRAKVLAELSLTIGSNEVFWPDCVRT